MKTQEKKQKLIPLLDYVLEQSENLKRAQDAFDKYVNIFNYAKFLSQPLKLSQFVPCDEEGNILEEPIPFFEHDKGSDFHAMQHINYEKAKSNVLFEWFYIGNYYQKEKALYNSHSNTIIPLPFEDYKTIESLLLFNLTLTENAVKTING